MFPASHHAGGLFGPGNANGAQGVWWQYGKSLAEALPSRTMSTVSKEEIRALSRLARLRLSDAEVDSLQGDLSGILEHMKVLADVDTTGITPMTHVGVGSGGLRLDEVAESLDRDTILAASHRVDDNCFAVPSILPTGGDQD